MARQAGDTLHASTEIIGHDDPTEATEPGDAVTVGADGNAAPAGDGDEVVGVRTRNRQTNDIASIAHDGVIVAKVEGTVSAGDGLDAGVAGAGLLETSAGGPAVALSDEGGEYRGAPIPAGHAAVLLR